MNFAFVGHCGSIQTEQSSNTSLMVREGAHTILIDVSGSPVQAMRKLDVDPVQLDAVILTHSHIDHIYALPSLLHNLWLMKRSRRLAIIANKETLQCAASLCSVFSLEAKNAFFGIDWTEATDMDRGNLHIHFFATDHGVPTIGCVFSGSEGKLTYTADTRPITLPPEAMDSGILVHEATGISAQEQALLKGGHSSARDAAQAALAINARNLYLVHTPADRIAEKAVEVEAKQVFSPSCIPELFRWF